MRNQARGAAGARQARALKCQERDFLGWIEPPQVGVKLQTVDHAQP